jgi:DNA-directed DNA polymerase III PolC
MFQACWSASRAGIPVVISNCVRFSRPDEYFLHKALIAIQTGTPFSNPPAAAITTAAAYLKSPQEMRERFSGFTGVWERTARLAEKCRGLPIMGNFRLPAYACPAGESEFSYLSRLSFAGMRQRYCPPTPKVLTHLARELEIIEQKNFSGYFLVVWDIVREARRRGIPFVCRGSAANSLVIYCLGLTQVEPLRHGLFFERFLNPERTDPPDIDIDFPWDQRDEILEYAFARFDPKRVAMICTFIKLQGRSAIREAGKLLGLTDAEISKFNCRLPYYGGVNDILMAKTRIPECHDLPIQEYPWRDVIKLAARLENTPRHLSVHPGGIVIAPDRVDKIMPRERSSKGLVVTQYDMYSVEDSGFVKIDLLGQRGLAVIRDAGRQAGLDWNAIDPTRDVASRALLAQGRTLGCFYVESPAMRLLLRKLRCESFELLTAASSIIRPGVSNSGMMRMFVERHLGRQKVQYAHPCLKPLLSSTYGVMVYQEDVIKVAHAVANISLAEADQLRQCMSKKRHWKKMDTYRERFFKGARENKVPLEAAREIWRQIESFGGYAFCKAHSASYAYLSFQSAYLKAHFPAEFMAAVLSNQGGFYRPAVYWEEARRLGLRLHPPDVNTSTWKYRSERRAIRAGLLHVKGLQHAHIEKLVAEREQNGLFKSLADLLQRTTLSLKEAEALIQAGACDTFSRNRAQLFWELHLARPAHPRRSNQTSPELPLTTQIDVPLVRGPDPDEALAMEFRCLDLSPRAHPLMLFRGRLSALAGGSGKLNPVAARDLQQHTGRQVWAYGWLVTWRLTRVHRTGEMMKFVTLEDLTATFEVTLFPDTYSREGHKLNGPGPYLVRGRVENDHGAITLTAERIENLSAERKAGIGTL